MQQNTEKDNAIGWVNLNIKVKIARKVLGKWYDENKQIVELGCIFLANR